MRPDLRLLAAALPALGGSLLLMRRADVGAGPLILQTAVAVVSFAAVALTRPRAAAQHTHERARLAVAIATVVVWAPVWTTSLAVRGFFGPHSRAPFPAASLLDPD